jgi:hypothetical protein
MCYPEGSVSQAVNVCPMCKVFPHSRCVINDIASFCRSSSSADVHTYEKFVETELFILSSMPFILRMQKVSLYCSRCHIVTYCHQLIGSMGVVTARCVIFSLLSHCFTNSFTSGPSRLLPKSHLGLLILVGLDAVARQPRVNIE